MSETVEMTDPVEQSVGGKGGHLLRRVFHLSISFIPWAYYWEGDSITSWLNNVYDLEWTTHKIASGLIILVILAEAIRLHLGITIYGQRAYEEKQVSALAWGTFSVGMVLLLAPEVGTRGAAYGMPIILSLSLGDPLLGELRRLGFDNRKVIILGTLGISLIWLASTLTLETPWWMLILLPPICVAAEWPRLRWIDDNATITLIPLSIILILHPWIA